MKRVHLFALLAIATLVVLLTSCGELVTPVAYTRFDTSADYDVRYTANMYYSQVEVYKDDDLVMVFDFHRCLGSDELDGKRYTLVDYNRKPDLTVSVYSPLYGSSKHLYLNDVILVPDNEPSAENPIYYFTSIEGFVRTNPDGQIDPAKVNVIEYR